jgi:AraC-like DNA-binding protein
LTGEHIHHSSDLPRHWVVVPPSVRAGALQKPLLRNLLPTHVGFFPRAAAHRVLRPQGTDTAIFKHCVRGKGWAEIRGRRFEIGPGDLLVVPRATAHAYGSDEKHPWTVYWFHAAGDHVELLSRELGVSVQQPVARIGKQPALVGLFEELRRTLEDDYSPPRLLYASQLLGHLVGLMIRMRRDFAGEAPDARQRVLASISYIKQHLDESFDLEALSAMAAVSVSHCSALFRKATGYSPKNYLTRLRVHRASQLLLTTTLSINAIADKVGFSDPLYFSKVFRGINKVPPSRYRHGRSAPDRGAR